MNAEQDVIGRIGPDGSVDRIHPIYTMDGNDRRPVVMIEEKDGAFNCITDGHRLVSRPGQPLEWLPHGEVPLFRGFGTFDAALSELSAASEAGCFPPDTFTMKEEEPEPAPDFSKMLWCHGAIHPNYKLGDTIQSAYLRILGRDFDPAEALIRIGNDGEPQAFVMPNGVMVFSGSPTEMAFIGIGSPLKFLAQDIHNNSLAHGFWGKPAEDGGFKVSLDHLMMKLMLIVSEVSEMAERLRKDPSKMDEHCPEFTNLEIEAADVIIRLLDLSVPLNLRLSEAITAKHNYNKGRPYLHGKSC